MTSFPSSPFLRIIPLGGVGTVTKNMYLYEYWQTPKEISDLLIVDCGIGFPDEEMYGIDLIIPDISYLKDKKEKIKGLVITHGHDDHLGALPYILPALKPIPVFATRLTAALGEVKLKNFGLSFPIQRADFSQILKLGSFRVEFVRITHSIPDTANLIIRTPLGNFYHGSDFKFDWTPPYGQTTQVGKIAQVGSEGILCLLSDCVRSESPGYTLSESLIEEALEKEIRNCPGKFIFTTQSSNISRIQQAINVALRHQRKIAFLGRSLEENTQVAKKLHYLSYPSSFLLREKELRRHPPQELFLIVTGCQAQPGSVLSRLAEGNYQFFSLGPQDKIVFSADPIPGYENAVHNLIDALASTGAQVSYSEITQELHVSGHGAALDLSLMIALTRPKFLLPIGGTVRQMKKYAQLAQEMGYRQEQILLPEEGEIILFSSSQKAKIVGQLDLKNVFVDGLGIGDIGNVVLRDRQTMAAEGIVIAVIPIAQKKHKIIREPDIISRGFVYMKKSNQLINQAKKVIFQSLPPQNIRILDWQLFRKQVEEKLAEFFYRETHRRPLVIAVIIKV